MSARSASLQQNRGIGWLLFAASFVAFAYFNQGGGWNQNSRFAMVRAIVEEGQFSIDDYLVYVLADQGTKLKRIPVSNAQYQIDGETQVILWKSKAGPLFPVSDELPGQLAAVDPSTGTIEVCDSAKVSVQLRLAAGVKIVEANATVPVEKLAPGQSMRVLCDLNRSGAPEATAITILQSDHAQDRFVFRELGSVAVSGDVAFYAGHFHPNKAPGTAFAAVPGYWLIFHLEKLLGADPDDWWTLTINGWLVSIFSVGLISAVGVSLFYSLTRQVFAGPARFGLIAACTFAFGTMFFPNATLLIEHNIVGVALLAGFYFLWVANRVSSPLLNRAYCFLAGLCAGWAAITTYIAVFPCLFLAGYGAVRVHRKSALLWLGFGLLGPLLLICAYNSACFNRPFTTNYHYQNPDFSGNPNAALAVLSPPRLDVLLIILFSPYRGLFFTAPVLVVAIICLFFWLRDQSIRPEGALVAAIFVFFVLFNISFNGWDGGDAAVPRYLGPAVPFLSLALMIGFQRFFKTTSILAGLSVLIMSLITVVDPQPPTGTGTAVVLDKPQWKYDPVRDYELPVFLHRKPLSLLREQENQVLRYYDQQLTSRGWTESARRTELERARDEIDSKIAAGREAPLILARTGDEYLVADSNLTAPIGPVSAHTYGHYGGWTAGDFGAIGSPQARWNSFNVGEFLFPESRASLFPLLIFAGLLIWFALANSGQLESQTSAETRNA